MPKSIEEKAGITYTTNDILETRVNFKINKNNSSDDSDAYEMIEHLKEKNINISKHIRLLLALEYRGEIYLNEKHQVINLDMVVDEKENSVSNNQDKEATIAASLQDNNVIENVEDERYIKYDESEDMPPSDDDF